MNIKEVKRTVSERNGFGQLEINVETKKVIECTKDDFISRIGTDMLVRIKRNSNTEFLFDNFSEWRKIDTRWMIVNLIDIKSATLAEKLDRNDFMIDELKIV